MTSFEVRLDMKVNGFWSRGITAFFDVRVSQRPSQEDLRKEGETVSYYPHE